MIQSFSILFCLFLLLSLQYFVILLLLLHVLGCLALEFGQRCHHDLSQKCEYQQLHLSVLVLLVSGIELRDQLLAYSRNEFIVNLHDFDQLRALLLCVILNLF